MTTEQEFFEAFGIEPVFNCGNSFWCDKEHLVKDNTQPNKKCAFYQDGVGCKSKGKNYPPITPEIVLELEEILLKKDFSITKYFVKKGKKKNNYCLDVWSYGGKYGCRKYHTTSVGALLNLFITIKDEVKPEVQQLFRED